MLQKDHEAYKTEASKRSTALQEDCKLLGEKADAAAQQAAKLRLKVQEVEESNQSSAASQAAGLAKAEVSLFSVSAVPVYCVERSDVKVQKMPLALNHLPKSYISAYGSLPMRKSST